jgi:thiol peroxidase
MEERTGSITWRGNPLTLLGKELHPGEPAPDFEVLDNSPETVEKP